MRLFVAISLMFLGLQSHIAYGLEKPVVQSFKASKLEVDLLDTDLSINFELTISHPKGIEETSTLLTFSNSKNFSLSVPLIRIDSPIDFSSTTVIFRGELIIPRSVNPGVYTYSVDGVKNNFDLGNRFPTGTIFGPTVRNLIGAESGILVRSNGNLNLDYETINGPAYGTQNGISYLDSKKFSSVPAPIWKVGEVFDPNKYFEVTVPGLNFKISTFSPNICTSDGRFMNLIAEGECYYQVMTEKNANYLGKSKVLSATITKARERQILKISSDIQLTPISLPTSLSVNPVYASGNSAVQYVFPDSLTPSICEASGYIINIFNSGVCALFYKSDGDETYLPSDVYRQEIQILNTLLPVIKPPEISEESKSVIKPILSLDCAKGKKIKKVIGVNPKCPKGFKIKK